MQTCKISSKCCKNESKNIICGSCAFWKGGDNFVYGLQSGSIEEDKDRFYDNLSSEMQSKFEIVLCKSIVMAFGKLNKWI